MLKGRVTPEAEASLDLFCVGFSLMIEFLVGCFFLFSYVQMITVSLFSLSLNFLSSNGDVTIINVHVICYTNNYKYM